MGNKTSSRKRRKSIATPTTKELSFSGGSMTRTSSFPRTPSLYPQISARVSRNHMAQFLDISVNNGVTGTFLSNRICAVMYTFWSNHIIALSPSQKREVSSAIYFGMIATSKSVKEIVFKICKTNPRQIEQLSLQFLDMMGWIVRNLIKDDIDLYTALKKMGELHRNLGITYDHFEPMLQSMHEVFQYYFDKGYSFEVKYAMDEIFILLSRIMMGQLPKNKSHLNNVSSTLHSEQIDFLQSLTVCLESGVGREYFIRYLQQTWCDEIAMWLTSIIKFKAATNDKQRFFIARNMIKVSIQPSSSFCINISYSARQRTLHGMKILEEQFACKKALNLDANFFSKVEREMTELLRRNHWVRFVGEMNKLKQECVSGTLVNPDLNDI